MLFNSVQFAIFLPLVVILYYLLPQKHRWILLLISSYYFYMCWRADFIILIILSTAINYFCSLKMSETDDPTLRKRYLYLSLVSSLGILFFFKYFNFFTTSLNDAFVALHLNTSIPYFNILLPVGISFFTFQTLSYTIDVYRGEKEVEKHFGIFAVYVAFFPQLVAGPIERSVNLLPQFYQKFSFQYENISAGVKLMIWGLFMKLVVADRAALYVDAVYNNAQSHDGLSFLLATFLFAFQIYGDFAGYSYIAIGAAKLMGFDLMTNFNRPYLAASVREFWQRWHISLSTWFRDYLYIPLGGNRVVKWRWYYNLFITFLVSGLWHGANWTFVVWGALHGAYLVLEIILGLSQKKGIFYIIYTFLVVNLAWIFFRANNIGDAFHVIRQIFTHPGRLYLPPGSDVVTLLYALIFVFLLIFMEIKREFLPDRFRFSESPYASVRMATYALLSALIIYFGVFGGGQFIYFQF